MVNLQSRVGGTALLLAAACLGMGRSGRLPERPDGQARRQAFLEAFDRANPLGQPEPDYPMPNVGLRHEHHESQFLDKAGAIFGLVQMGVAPRERLAEANRLLRYQMLGKYRLTNAGQVAGDSGIWMHRSRSLGMRLYLLYSDWLEQDVRSEYERRLEWLAREPFVRKSENIKMTNTSSYFLAHEILGRTGSESYSACREWLLETIGAWARDGLHEWGSPYAAWTLIAVLNLAEFAEDPGVQELALMYVDYALARQLTSSVGPFFCSPGNRRYIFWSVNGFVEPRTRWAQLLFTDSEPAAGQWGDFLDFVLSRYAPLDAHRHLASQQGPYEASYSDHIPAIERTWRAHFHRGQAFGLATHQTTARNQYQLYHGGTHDVVGCYVQSAAGARHHVVPYGHRPVRSPKKKRNLDERYFSYRNLAFVHHGGTTRAVWAGPGRVENVRIRLFAYRAFRSELTTRWAFLTDGTAYVAWAPTRGRPELDPDSTEYADPEAEGYCLRSSHVPGDEGETAVLEAGDAAAYGSFEAFRASVLERNPDPSPDDQGVVCCTAPDGARLEFGPDFVRVDGRLYEPKGNPRVRAPGLNGFTIEIGGEKGGFDFDQGERRGNLTRCAPVYLFGLEEGGGPTP
jgi:hypothetical protein